MRRIDAILFDHHTEHASNQPELDRGIHSRPKRPAHRFTGAFVESFHPDHHPQLILALIEILTVDDAHRGHGARTALLRYAEQHFRELGVRLILAKVDAADTEVMLWCRHRGYTLATGVDGIKASPEDGVWRLAVKVPSFTIARCASALWLTPAD